ncbi:MAG: leucine-rich repeat domain-containing protein, partial [Clostridia bacterium]|nr:leucine-rich repeat domain-containing protein [Clostridia bacterium]
MNGAKKGYEYTRYYNSLLGLDLTEVPSASASMRMSNIENMYRDYYGNDGTALETVPGFRRLFRFTFEGEGRRINAIRHYTPKGADEEFLVIHAGRSLYRVPLAKRDEEAPELIPIISYSGEFEIREDNPLANKKSHMFEEDGRLFILDGEDYFCLDGASLKKVSDIAYIPTTFSDGEAYEQRNLLTDRFRVVYNLQNSIDSLLRYEKGSRDLVYRITGDSTCTVEGLASVQTNIYIPARTEINGRSYEVEGISPYAFKDNDSLSEVKIAEGVKTVGRFAFYNCVALKKVSLPNSLKKLEIGAFMNTPILNSIVMGSSLSSIHASCFYGSGLSKVYFTSSEDEWNAIEKNASDTVLSKVTLIYRHHEKSGSFIFYLNERCREINEILLGDEALTTNGKEISYAPLYENDYIYAILINTPDVNLLFSRRLEVLGRGDSQQNGNIEHADILRTPIDLAKNAYGIISECRMTAAFDGRVFFSGNPKFPSTVFYSSRGKEGFNLPEY